MICKILLTDCDGVLTDDGMYYSKEGEALKKFNTRDGMAFELLRNSGILTGIITGENSESVAQRAKKIKADELHLGVKDKLSVVKEICKKYKISLSEIAYIGDDINDIEILKNVGLACCPCNAQQEVKEIADIVAKSYGGTGVVREITDKILKEFI